jgi:hypothetical protein
MGYEGFSCSSHRDRGVGIHVAWSACSAGGCSPLILADSGRPGRLPCQRALCLYAGITVNDVAEAVSEK